MFLNKVFLIGNLTRKPEVRHTNSGKMVANFSIAVNEMRSAKREEAPPMFIKVEAWERQAEIAEKYLDKGSMVLVEGRLKIDEYTTREGEKRRDPVVSANQITLGPKPRSQGGGDDDYRTREDSSDSYGGGERSQSREPGRSSAPDDYGYGDEPSRESGGARSETDDDLPF